MIDIPIGKALVPIEGYHGCDGCIFKNGSCIGEMFRILNCFDVNRKDDKNVVFQLIDWPVEDKK